MSIDLICPECGGIIGGDATDPGRACTCAANNLQPEAHSSHDTVVEKEAAAPTKACCQCGKDLSGKKRLRDSRGYWCPECHRTDKAANEPKGLKCADCGRVLPEAALTDVGGELLCGKCNFARKEQAKELRRRSPVQTHAHAELDKKRIFWMLGVVGVLVLIILLKHFNIIGR